MSRPDLRIMTFDTRLRSRFRHASAARTRTENLIVAVSAEDRSVSGYGEACPRTYVTGETVESVAAFIRQVGPELVREIESVEDLRTWISRKGDAIDNNPAAFGALEIAMLDWLAHRERISLEALLGQPELPERVTYSAVLGDGALPVFALQALAYRAAGFHDVKIKLSGDPMRDRRKLDVLHALFGGNLRVRADANNLWESPDHCIAQLGPPAGRIWALEEPLSPGDLDGCRRVARELGVQIILDESLCRVSQLAELEGDPEHWIANIRVSKSGGILRSIELARGAQAIGVPVILGAHVGETSILSRAALTVGAGLDAAPVAREGAFGTWLLAEDLTERPIRFGRFGELGHLSRFAARSGLGITVMEDRCEELARRPWRT